MKTFILKAIAAIVSVFIAGALWIGSMLLLKNSGVSFLQTLAVYISQLSFIGWLLFGLLAIMLYLVIVKFMKA